MNDQISKRMFPVIVKVKFPCPSTFPLKIYRYRTGIPVRGYLYGIGLRLMHKVVDFGLSDIDLRK